MVLRLVGVVAVFSALAIAATLPLINHFTTHIPIAGDSPYHLGWALAWGAHALATDPLHLFDANLGYPLERSFAFSEHLLGLQPLFAPVYLLTGNPTAGYNAVFVLSFALSGLSAFALVRHLTRAFWPALVAGVLFGFAPVRFGHIHHLHVLVFFWAPLALLFLDRFLRSRRWGDLGAFAAFFWLQVLSSIYLGVMLAVAAAVYAAYHAVAVDRSLVARPMLPKVVALVAASAAVLGPIHWPYVALRRAWGDPWTMGALVGGSASLSDYLVAPSLINPTYVGLSRRLLAGTADDRMLFPGLVLPALVLVGLVTTVRALAPAEARRLRLGFGLVAGAGFLLSLGPQLRAWDASTEIPLPALLLYYVIPGWGVVRIPARFAMLALLGATPLAALGVLRCCEAASRWSATCAWARGAPAAVGLTLAALALAELGLPRMPLDEAPTTRVPEAYRWLARERPGPILEVPMGEEYYMRYLYLSTVHWLPVVTPRGSFAPRAHDELRQALEELPAPRALEQVAALGIKAVVLHTDRMDPEALARWTARESRDRRLRRLATFDSQVIYGVPAVEATHSLAGDLAAPAWLPAGQVVRLGLVLRGVGERPWAHPPPHGRSEAKIEWTELATGRATTEWIGYAFPLAVAGDETARVQLRLETPTTPARYRLHVTVPARGIDTGPRIVDVRAEEPPTSRDAGDRLRAAYAEPAPPAVVPALDALPLRLSAVNTGEAVWLSKAPSNRGEVALAWRWLRVGRPPAGFDDRVRVRHDVFPGQRYTFDVVVWTPPEPGAWELELGLVSIGVARFEEVGTPPLRLPVRVEPARGDRPRP